MRKSSLELTPIIVDLINKKVATTQTEICKILNKKGLQVNQAKISRLLHKIGAVRVKDPSGKISYWLPKEPPPIGISKIAENLIVDVMHNETIVVIRTTPGAAPVVSRALDYVADEIEIIRSLSGTDTIFVAPKSVSKTEKVYEKIRKLIWEK